MHGDFPGKSAEPSGRLVKYSPAESFAFPHGGLVDGSREMKMNRMDSAHRASVVGCIALCFFCVGLLAAPYAGLAAEAKKENILFKVAFGALVGTESGMRLEPVRNSTILKSGDKFKMMLEMEKKCYLYVIYKNSQGEMSLLFPYGIEQFETNYETSRKYFLPPREAWYELDNRTGSETFYVIASSQRLRDVEYLFTRYDSAEPARKRGIALQVLSALDRIRTEHRDYTIVAEAPLTSDTTTRGVERSQGADPTDISCLATQVRASDFYSKTYVIEHR